MGTITIGPVGSVLISYAGGPPSVAVQFVVTYADGTAGTSLPTTTDATGNASVTLTPTSTSAITVTVDEVLATATA
jgi:hypothetical protein